MRPSRIALLSLAGLAIVLVAVALAAYVAARLAWFERRAADWAAGKLGVPVVVGELAVGYLPSPWVAVERVALGEAAGADGPAVFEARAARIELPWRTVLGRAARVNRIELSSPALSLKTDATGAANWTPLLDGLRSLGGEGEGAAWSIGAVGLAGGSLDYRDAREAVAVGLTGIALEAQDVAPGEDFPLRLRAAGQSGEYTFHAAIDGFARIDPDAKAYGGEQLALRGWLGGGGLGLGGVELAGEAGSVTADLERDALAVRALRFEGLGVQATGEVEVSHLAGERAIAFELATEPFAPRALANSLNVPLPETADPAVLARAELRARGMLDASGLALSGIEGRLDESAFSGEAFLPAGATAPRLRLEVDAIILDGYLPPEGDAPASPQETAARLLSALRELDIDAEVAIGRAEAAGVIARGLSIVVEPNRSGPGGSEQE